MSYVSYRLNDKARDKELEPKSPPPWGTRVEMLS